MRNIRRVVESTGEVIFLSQSETNISLTDEQKKQATDLLAAEPNFGRQHEKEVAKLKEACKEWAIVTLNDEHPILLDALLGRMPDQAVRESFPVGFLRRHRRRADLFCHDVLAFHAGAEHQSDQREIIPQ